MMCVCIQIYKHLFSRVGGESVFVWESCTRACLSISNCEVTCVFQQGSIRRINYDRKWKNYRGSTVSPERRRKWKSSRKARLVKKPAAIVVWLRTRFEPSRGAKLFTQQGNNKMVFAQVHACAYRFSLWLITLRESITCWVRRLLSTADLNHRFISSIRILQFFISCLSVTTSVYILYSTEGTQKPKI